MMHRNYFCLISPLLAILLLSSCSVRNYEAAVVGGQVGGMLGTIVGDVVGPKNGPNLGGLIGMAAGSATAVAISNAQAQKEQRGAEMPPHQRKKTATLREKAIPTVSFFEYESASGNFQIISGERGVINMEFYNRTGQVLTDITPTIKCSSSRVLISPSVSIPKIKDGGGIRYQVFISPKKRLKTDEVTFTVYFNGIKANTYHVKVKELLPK